MVAANNWLLTITDGHLDFLETRANRVCRKFEGLIRTLTKDGDQGQLQLQHAPYPVVWINKMAYKNEPEIDSFMNRMTSAFNYEVSTTR